MQFARAAYDARNLNKHMVLDHIRFARQGFTRVALARELGLSRAAVSTIVNELIARGLVREAERVSTTGGRPPIRLEINPECGYVVGVDIGVTHVTLVLADFAGRALSERREPLSIDDGPKDCLRQVDVHLKALLESVSLPMEQIAALTVGVPGPVSADDGTVIAPPVMPGWERYPIVQTLQDRWARPVLLANDADLGALGEWVYGAGRDTTHLAFVKVGSGVGAGFIFNGEIYRGTSGLAGEIGHITLIKDGPLCTCGNRGCLEALAGGRAIARQAQDAVRRGLPTRLEHIRPVEGITARDVAIAAQMGDLLAQQIVQDAGHYLGIAIANIINLLNPDAVVIGGGVAQMGDLLLEPIRHTVRERSLGGPINAVRIVSAVLGMRSSAMGAVTYALTYALHTLADS
ncbi:MAG: ROK family transcriptional regulator [Anaerolineae bacterium]|nr:MAG: ROK family transcriptional regulator [Anaerolineae bacterium]